MFCLATSRNLRNPARSLIALIRIGFTSCRFYRPSAISVNMSNRKMTHDENLQVQQQQQSLDYFLVLDFEATCAKDKKLQPQEIVEFPVLKVNGRTFETEAIFHQYVQPRIHPQLSPFCTELTGIIQDMVDGQPHLEETLQKFDRWMADEGLLNDGVQSAFVTCGEWDLKTMLPQQCKYFDIPYPSYLKQWINVKNAYCEHQGNYGRGMMAMMNGLGLKHEGQHHSGIGEVTLYRHSDDCRNIAKILKELAQRGFIYRRTGEVV